MAPVKSVLYADDTTIVTRNPYYGDLIAESMENRNNAVTWFANNVVKFNQEKTKSLLFCCNILNQGNAKLMSITLDNSGILT